MASNASLNCRRQTGIDFFDGLCRVPNGIEQILALAGEELEALLGFGVLLDGHHVDGAHRIHLLADFLIFLLAQFQIFGAQRFEDT